MPRSNPDAGLQVALEQRRRILETAQLELAERERVVMEEARHLAAIEARVAVAHSQLAEAHAAPGRSVDVGKLSELDTFLQICERDAAAQSARLSVARSHSDDARQGVVAAHQQVRSLELVLEARAAARAEERRRSEARQADEIGSQLHTRRRAKAA